MKGISTVIATILMLIITIAMAGVAYSYMSGYLTGTTAVVLQVSGAPQCLAGQSVNSIIIWIENRGTSTSGTLTWTDVPGNPSTISNCTFGIPTLAAGNVTAATCNRSSAGAGNWYVRIGAPGVSPVTAGPIYCTS